MDREKTGITALDKMLTGGVPQGGIIGIMGPSGVGKSILALHLLLEGAREKQAPLYLNLDEPEENIHRMVEQFSFAEEFERHLSSGQVRLRTFSYEKMDRIYSEVFEKVRDTSARRLVMDSYNMYLSSRMLVEESENWWRQYLFESISALRAADATVFLVLEGTCRDHPDTLTRLIPYYLDGIIELDYVELEEIERKVSIPKMRWTNHAKRGKFYRIGKNGIFIRQ